MILVEKIQALCPAGDLDNLRSRLKGPQGLNVSDFQGECDPERLKALTLLLPGPALRRAPRLAKLALSCALDVVRPEGETASTALILLSAYGSVGPTFDFLDSIINDGANLASPTAFSHSVTNMSAAYLSQLLHLTGPALSLTQPSFAAALEAAELLLKSEQAETVLLGAVSEYSETMSAVEKKAGRPPALFSDGAVFFRMGRAAGLLTNDCKPEPGLSEPDDRICLDFYPSNPSAGGRPFDPLPAELPGSSVLTPALRLALACRAVADDGLERSTILGDAGQSVRVSVLKAGH